jgi:hypothetical protein
MNAPPNFLILRNTGPLNPSSFYNAIVYGSDNGQGSPTARSKSKIVTLKLRKDDEGTSNSAKGGKDKYAKLEGDGDEAAEWLEDEEEWGMIMSEV